MNINASIKKNKIKKCQVSTPENYVEILLNKVGYIKKLYGKKVLENSCGEGNILKVIVKRYIEDSIYVGLTLQEIKIGLEKDIIGYEIDHERYIKCIDSIEEIANNHNIFNVKWSIKECDYLKNNNEELYDFVIGNPPYISYDEISSKDKKYLMNNYISCANGRFDYCYAFIEKSIKSLSSEGVLAYIIPTSIFKTKSGTSIRQLMKPFLSEIHDFKDQTMFPGITIKSSIIVLKNNQMSESLLYFDSYLNCNTLINKNELHEKWIFEHNFNHGKKRFGDYFKVANSPATLLNSAFVIKDGNYEKVSNYFYVNNLYLEKELIKEAIAPKNINSNKKEIIIFPYIIANKTVNRINENDFKNHYPGVYNYLYNHYEKLSLRKSDNKTQWFEYGRNQALNISTEDKLVLSTIVTKRTKVCRYSKRVIPYSGLTITSKNEGMSLENALNIIQSSKFINYCYCVGIPINGNSVRITSKDIENYMF